MKIFIKRYQVERKWEIVGFPNYFFGSDKNLYNARTLRILKRCLVGYTQGYYPMLPLVFNWWFNTKQVCDLHDLRPFFAVFKQNNHCALPSKGKVPTNNQPFVRPQIPIS